MAGLDPAIHVLRVVSLEDMDARHKAGHDEEESFSDTHSKAGGV
jgi:hypothetical protein